MPYLGKYLTNFTEIHLLELELGIPMVTSGKSFELNQNNTLKRQNPKNTNIGQFCHLLTYSDMLVIKKLVLKPGNSNNW